MRLSVVIPCFNGETTIGAQLDALAEQQWSDAWEIIVVNNRSADASVSVVKRYQARLPNLRIVEAPAKQSTPYALNKGVGVATGEALLFSDADDVVGEGYITAMGEALLHHDFVACRFDTEKLNAPWVQRSHDNLQRQGLIPYTYPRYLPHAGGSGLGVKRALFEAMRGFDETLLALQDTDFCWRLQLAGVPLHFVANAVVHVRYRSTLPGLYCQARRYAEYNVLLYKRYRSAGMPAISWEMSATAWRKLARRLVHVHNRGDIARAAWDFGWRVGRVRGSIKHRVLAL